MSDQRSATALLLDQRMRDRLAEIAALESTVDLTQRDRYVAAEGWNVDAREIALPPEMPGAPEARGSFVLATEILRAYAFTPRRLIRGSFDPDAPLLDRPMLLTARFLWMRFELGVRVNRVIDETRVVDGENDYVWGYSYHTLAGHLERGEITFEIAKRLRTGAVAFRVHSFSQTGHIANWFYRIGFWFVGRRLQQHFAERSLTNMQRLVVSALRADTQRPSATNSRTTPD